MDREEIIMINGRTVEDYFFVGGLPTGHISQNDFEQHPATAFLSYCLDAKNAIELCKTNFPKIDANTMEMKSNIAIQNIINSMLVSIMSYFEMYEKYLFAGLFEYSIYLSCFNAKNFCKGVFGCSEGDVNMHINEFLAYRTFRASAGLMIADQIKGWHDPTKVNEYFKSLGLLTQAFSNDDIKDLKTLWQIRHSIAHNASTISKPDAQKLDQLHAYGGKTIVFSNKFIYELVKRMHSMVYSVTLRLQQEFIDKMVINASGTEKQKVIDFLRVQSRNHTWLV